jgi:hypothetical protein
MIHMGRFISKTVTLLTVAVFLDLCSICTVHAAEPPEFPIRVEVRTIRAEGALSQEQRGQATPVALDSRIADLASQLERLEYANFKMVDLQSLVIQPRKRIKIELSEGQQLTLRPIAVEGEQLCLWLRWRDRTGMQLLETRLRFTLGQSMLTGTDHAPDKGLILAIKVESAS